MPKVDKRKSDDSRSSSAPASAPDAKKGRGQGT